MSANELSTLELFAELKKRAKTDAAYLVKSECIELYALAKRTVERDQEERRSAREELEALNG
jgi:hypothetical protein